MISTKTYIFPLSKQKRIGQVTARSFSYIILPPSPAFSPFPVLPNHLIPSVPAAASSADNPADIIIQEKDYHNSCRRNYSNNDDFLCKTFSVHISQTGRSLRPGTAACRRLRTALTARHSRRCAKLIRRAAGARCNHICRSDLLSAIGIHQSSRHIL